MKPNWRVLVFGAGGIGYTLFDVTAKLADGDAATNPDWTTLAIAVAAIVGALIPKAPAK